MNKLVIAMMALGFAVTSQATGLKDVYQQALANDPQLAAELASANAKAQSQGLAGAAIMPTLTFNADIGTNTTEVNSVDTDVDVTAYKLTFSQTLIAPEAWFSYGAASALSDAAELEARKAEQDLVVRVSESYFNVLRANSGLASAKATEAAVKRQLEQTQQRFKVGLIAITDVHEAQAQYDSATVDLISAETSLDIAYESLAVLTGERYDRILPLKEEIPLLGPMPADRTHWEQKALGQNLDVLISEQNQIGAQRNHKSKISGHLPTVSLRASYELSVDGGSSDPTQLLFDEDKTSTYVGVNVSLPIFSGGSTWAGQKQAYYQRQAAEYDFEAARRGASLNVRNLYRTLEADIARIKARKQAMTSAKSAMEATQTGYEVGTRNIVEVLTAQRSVFGAQFNYAAARYEYVINVLKFRQSVGELSVADIDEVSNWLQN
jgi:outer membrane protein